MCSKGWEKFCLRRLQKEAAAPLPLIALTCPIWDGNPVTRRLRLSAIQRTRSKSPVFDAVWIDRSEAVKQIWKHVTVNQFNSLKLSLWPFPLWKRGGGQGKMAPKYSSRTLEWLNVSNWAAVYEPCSFSSVLVQHLPDFGCDLSRMLRDLVWQSHVGWEERQKNSDRDEKKKEKKKCSSTFKTHSLLYPGAFQCPWTFTKILKVAGVAGMQVGALMGTFTGEDFQDCVSAVLDPLLQGRALLPR